MRFTSKEQQAAVMSQYTKDPVKGSRMPGAVTQTQDRKDPAYDFRGKTVLTEREVNLFLRRVNSGKISPDPDWFPEDGYRLTPDQDRKGLDWLRDKMMTPRGVMRKNNPFDTDEQRIIRAGGYFTFDGVRDGNASGSWQVPIYTLHTPQGWTFSYSVIGGEVRRV